MCCDLTTMCSILSSSSWLIHAARADQQPAGRAMGERVDLIVIHAGQMLHRLGNLDQRGQRRDVEDRAFLDLQHHDEGIRFAERAAVAVVGLDEGMLLRQQVAEVECEPAAREEHAEEQRHDRDRGNDTAAVLDQRLGEAPDSRGGGFCGHWAALLVAGTARRQLKPRRVLG